MHHIRLFLSSPGDVTTERIIAQEVIEQIHYDPSFRGRVFIEVVAWDKPGSDTPMLATLTPQEAINQGLPKPSDCDIVIVIFWARMGTPLPEEFVKPESHRFTDPGGLAETRYLSGTEWEFVDAFEGAIEDGLPQVVVYRRTEKVLLDDESPDYPNNLIQKRRVRAFFDHFSNPDGSIRQGYNPYEQPEAFRKKLDAHLRTLLVRLLDGKTRRGEKVREKALWPRSPFPGLRAFTPEDAPIFFGRGKETDDLIERLNHSRFVAVVGASGAGKSSLVWAGLIPRLEANAIASDYTGSKDWRWLRFTPGDNPFLALADDRLEENPENIVRLADEMLADRPPWAELLLFIDQFEELLTLTAEKYRVPFARLLAAAARSERVRVVVTLRADFYHQLIAVDKSLTELLQKGSYPLGAPDDIALHEMITRPAERAGLRFEGDLDRRIVHETGGEPGTLALMAYLLDELYHRRSADGTLTVRAYEELGGVQGAIGRRAEAIFNGLDAAAQAMLPRIFHALVEVDERGTATRQRASLEQVIVNEAARRLVEAFTRARLLVRDEKAGQPIVEVAHEALLRRWERLAEWIETTQDDLRLLRQVRLAAVEWEQHGSAEAYRWPDERLQPVYQMIERLALDEQRDFNEAERDFIRREFDRLLEVLQDPDTTHQRRSRIGERLCVIGDRRKGVGLRDDGLPDIDWCKVEIEGQSSVEVDIEKIGRVTVELPFYIARYPVTYLQFQAFVEAADGINDPHWWQGLAAREEDKTLISQRFQFINHPRDSVNWYQAIAFCRWLSYRLGGTYELQQVMDWPVRLPTEAEWQLAANGGDPANVYPWGGEWDGRFANARESGLSRSTGVGMYPHGAARCRALDMAGNVWEWTLTEYGSGKSGNFGNDNTRVLRGGSWSDGGGLVRAVSRGNYPPDGRPNVNGFRVCVAAPVMGR